MCAGKLYIKFQKDVYLDNNNFAVIRYKLVGNLYRNIKMKEY